MRTEVLAVSGRLDRLDVRDGADGEVLVVVDYKTGRRELTVFDARSSLALALYARAAGRTFRRDCLRVELHHVPSGEVVGHEHTVESLQRHLARAESIGLRLARRTPPFARGCPAPRPTSCSRRRCRRPVVTATSCAAAPPGSRRTHRRTPWPPSRSTGPD
jgi:putative RecB family exonuclease